MKQKKICQWSLFCAIDSVLLPYDIVNRELLGNTIGKLQNFKITLYT